MINHLKDSDHKVCTNTCNYALWKFNEESVDPVTCEASDLTSCHEKWL